jgi:hypothetical protein
LICDVARLAEDSAYREDCRHLFITDHFFAAEVIGYHDFTERAHRPAVNLYFPKNPNVPIRDQHRKHKRIHLDPRHSFKTSLKRVDRLQWICAFPEEITILNNSATQPLAWEVSFKTALQFFRPKGSGTKPIHYLFPQLIVDKRPTGSWNTPNRKTYGSGDLDYTLNYTSPRTSQSGWHPYIIDYDDVEDSDNSGITAKHEVRENVINICDQNENTLRDGGFIFIGGTRYHPLDYYGKCLMLAQQNPENWEVLVRSSLTLKNGTRLLPGEFPPEDEMELHFAEFHNLSYLSLREKFYQNYQSFMAQQQNDPQGGAIPRFDEKLYRSCMIVPERIPLGGEVFIAWRPRYGGKKSMAKYSEGAAAKILDGRIYVLDAWQGTYTPSGEAEKIVRAAKEHQADGLMIVEVPGSEYVMNHVRNEAAKRNRSFKMQWIEYEEDEARRTAAMEQIEPLMKVGRICFSTAISKGVECQNQFLHFGLMEENGIVDAISKFAALVPLSQMRANMSAEEIEYQRRRRDDALVSAFLDQQGMPTVDEQARQKAAAQMSAMGAISTYRMPPLPGGLDG